MPTLRPTVLQTFFGNVFVCVIKGVCDSVLLSASTVASNTLRTDAQARVFYDLHAFTTCCSAWFHTFVLRLFLFLQRGMKIAFPAPLDTTRNVENVAKCELHHHTCGRPYNFVHIPVCVTLVSWLPYLSSWGLSGYCCSSSYHMAEKHLHITPRTWP